MKAYMLIAAILLSLPTLTDAMVDYEHGVGIFEEIQQ